MSIVWACVYIHVFTGLKLISIVTTALWTIENVESVSNYNGVLAMVCSACRPFPCTHTPQSFNFGSMSKNWPLCYHEWNVSFSQVAIFSRLPKPAKQCSRLQN